MRLDHADQRVEGPALSLREDQGEKEIGRKGGKLGNNNGLSRLINSNDSNGGVNATSNAIPVNGVKDGGEEMADIQGNPGKIVGMRDIRWEHIEFHKMMIFGSSLFFCVRALVYPFQVVKTRIVMTRKGQIYPSTLSAFKTILHKEGFHAMYRGFFFFSLGHIPTQALSMTLYESIRSRVRLVAQNAGYSRVRSEIVANGTGGAIASLTTQLFIVPVDVITQRLMIQSKFLGNQDFQTNYKNALDVGKQILKKDGVLGFYRGFIPSIFTYIPANAAWWATYGFAKNKLCDLRDAIRVEPLTYGEDLGIQVTSAVTAATASVTITQPMDVLKTRRQMGTNKSENLGFILRQLIKEEGIFSLSKGYTARILSAAPVSVRI